MEKTKRHSVRIAIAILAILLVSSALAVFSNSTNTTAAAADNSDILQYDWPYGAYNESRVLSYDGPAPNKPDLLWNFTPTLPPGLSPFARYAYYPSSAVTCFNGKAFVCSSNSLYALDPFTGSQIWRANLTGLAGFVPVGAWKLDDTYLCVDTGMMSFTGAGGTQGRLACYRIDDGTKVWDVSMGIAGHAGAELKNYWPMTQSVELKMKYVLNYNTTTLLNKVVAWNLSATPAAPHIEWEYIVDEPCEILCFGDGKLFVGTYTYHIFALDGKTGDLVWKARSVGLGAYSAIYANGRLYHGDATTRLTCYNASTGDILWDDVNAGREFFSYGEAYAYGRIFAKNVGVPEGFIGCWDAESGEQLWKTAPAYYELGYLWPCVGDGKVYTIRSDGTTFAGRVPMQAHFACLDAFTGEEIWTLPYQFTAPTLGYGMLFGVSGGSVLCFADVKKPWSYFRGNTDKPGVGQSGPNDISSPKWTYTTEDAVQSSPAIVDGKVYIGSNDQNLYCLDAYTGKKIWNFSTEYKLRSSPAVSGGKVFTGADDGYIYCIDAETGTEIWKKNIYAGNVPPILIEVSSFQPRSSPIIVGDRLYVGALDNKVYCLGTADGSVKWTYITNGPICGSPAYSNGTIYIASTDRNMYALDATTGTKIWNWTTPKVTTQLHFATTPVIAEGKVFFGGGAAYSAVTFTDVNIIFVALYANNGTQAWRVNMDTASNTQPIQAPTYYKGVIYISDHMGMSARYASNGSRIWYQWLGFQVFSSAAVADDLRSDATGQTIGAKVYVGCDSYSVTCLKAVNGTVLSRYVTEGQVSSSPAIWDGKLYVGSVDGKVYCFDDAPRVSTGIYAASNKGAQMWSNETITISGKLNAIENYTNAYDVTKQYYPGLPNATVILSINKPDLSAVNVTTTTDNMGHFTASYSPTQAGNWGWVAYYEGQQLPYITYNAAYTEWNPFEVASPPTSGTTPTPTPTPTPAGTPVEYIYAAVAIIAIILIAISAYAYTRRTKK